MESFGLRLLYLCGCSLADAYCAVTGGAAEARSAIAGYMAAAVMKPIKDSEAKHRLSRVFDR